jgi:UDP-GlcNAc:undecaprenyl-phosphate GlcNAc-1-phosphate transferase
MILVAILVACVACGLSLMLTPAMRTVARRVGLVDKPDARRKLHGKAIPVAGGIAVFLALCGTLSLAALVPSDFRQKLEEHFTEFWATIAASIFVVVLGVADDYWGIRGLHKLLGQIGAVAILLWSGILVQKVGIFGMQIDLGWFAIPFTAFWLLACINSLNLIDGMDGMLSTVALIVCLTLGIMGLWASHPMLAIIAFALAGAIGGFLPYNLPPASIFLGDAGSMLIGLLIGTLSIKGSLKAPTTIALSIPIALLFLPIMDTFMAIVRRKLTGRSLYCTDRGHVHHCLLRKGMSNKKALVLVLSVCGITSVAALGSVAFQNEYLAIATAMAAAMFLIATRLFGHGEFLLVKQHMLAMAHTWLRLGKGQTNLQVRLQGTINWDVLWEDLKSCAAEMRLESLALVVDAPVKHELYHAFWRQHGAHRANQRPVWHAEFPICSNGGTFGTVRASGPAEDNAFSEKIASLTSIVQSFPPLAALAAPYAQEPAPVKQPHATPRRVMILADDDEPLVRPIPAAAPQPHSAN